MDPGSLTAGQAAPSSSYDDEAAEAAVNDPVTVPTLETIRDRVRTHISENFKGHRLTELVAAILRIRGFVCDVSSPGPDQGVDILAGSGPLGLDSPTLIVEVKQRPGRFQHRWSAGCKAPCCPTGRTKGCSSPGAA